MIMSSFVKPEGGDLNSAVCYKLEPILEENECAGYILAKRLVLR